MLAEVLYSFLKVFCKFMCTKFKDDVCFDSLFKQISVHRSTMRKVGRVLE